MKRFFLLVAAAVGLSPLTSGSTCQAEPRQTAARTIRVAAVQMRGEQGGIEVNQAKAEVLIREAADRGAEFILLPELYGLFPVAIWAKTADEVRREAQGQGQGQGEGAQLRQARR